MPNYVFFDTETDGLNIITNNPFSYQVSVGLNDPPKYWDVTKKTTKQMLDILSQPDTWLIGHNIKFDIHMLINKGIPITLFKNIHIIDTMFMARLAIDHDVQAGNKRYNIPPVSLSLKNLSKKYLGADSKDEELILKEKFKELNAQHKLLYRQHLVSVIQRVPNTSELNEFYNMTASRRLVTDLDQGHISMMDAWLKQNPKPTYKDIPRYILEPYAIKDIVLTKGLFTMFLELIKFKKQSDIFVRESKAMYPLLLMEREGLTVDRTEAMLIYEKLYRYYQKESVYLAPVNLVKPGAQPIATYFQQTTTPSIKSNTVVYDKDLNVYLEYKKSDVIAIEGQPMNLKSSQQMAALYRYETGDDTITTANKETRVEILSSSPTAAKIQMLSPLNKMLDTYLPRLIDETVLDKDGNYKLYSMYNNLSDSYNESDDSAGTVTGRLSGDMQQFPKEPLLDTQGNELVNIRKLFIVPKGKHSMWYFDMSQLELRLQTIWSAIIDGKPDKTMARGFVPYDCIKINDKYYLNEDHSIEWQPTDFHTIAAQTAFGHLPDYQTNKKHYRSLGKRSNFAISYGASKWKVMESLKVSEQEAEALITGFKNAYVGLTHMDKYLRSVTRTSEFQTNLFGRRYYIRDVHKLKNWLVQGSGGDLLKIFLVRLLPFVEKYPHWHFMLTVHDEIDFVLDKEPTKNEIQEVLNIMFYSAGGIDVTAEPEYTLTSWGEKLTFDLL